MLIMLSDGGKLMYWTTLEIIIGVNRPAIVREIPHFGIFPAFPHFCENIPHFWLYFEMTKIDENKVIYTVGDILFEKALRKRQ